MNKENLTSCGSDLIGRSIRVLPVVASTNDLLKAEAEQGKVEEGAVVLAEYQSSGRGRLDRQWEAPPGKSLLFSTLLFPETSQGNLQLTGLLTSLAMLDGLTSYFKNDTEEPYNSDVKIRLKWPNDLVVEKRKLCGILSDAGVDVLGRNFVVVGVGLNVNQSLNDFPEPLRRTATSLYLMTGHFQSRERILKAVIASLENYYLRLKTDGYAWIPATWLERAGIMGKRVEVSDNGGKLTGACAGLADDGALMLNLPDGKQKMIYSGDIS